MQRRITKATFKSFIKKNYGKLFMQHISSFDGMSDMVEYLPQSKRVFKKAEYTNDWEKHSLGI